jgi:hypothetical protein
MAMRDAFQNAKAWKLAMDRLSPYYKHNLHLRMYQRRYERRRPK